MTAKGMRYDNRDSLIGAGRIFDNVAEARKTDAFEGLAALSIFRHLSIGTMILSPEGRIILSNDEAERILEERDGLQRSACGGLRITDEYVGADLSNAVAAAARAADGRDAAAVLLVVERDSGLEPYSVTVQSWQGDGLAAGALVLVVDLEQRAASSMAWLARACGLTEAEAGVCRMIADGLTSREIAEERNVSIDTVKTQSRAIFSKTQTRNRTELARRAYHLVPPLQ